MGKRKKPAPKVAFTFEPGEDIFEILGDRVPFDSWLVVIRGRCHDALAGCKSQWRTPSTNGGQSHLRPSVDVPYFLPSVFPRGWKLDRIKRARDAAKAMKLLLAIEYHRMPCRMFSVSDAR